MKIETLDIQPYQLPLTTGQVRFGVVIKIVGGNGNSSSGDVAPLPKWSRETLDDCLQQLQSKLPEILAIDWTLPTWRFHLQQLALLPALSFGLESAILSILAPVFAHNIPKSALFMGTPDEILTQAELRLNEGYSSAKLKVSNLTFNQAAHLIHQLQDKFRLRIDVNRAWNTSDSLSFFSQFPSGTFDYVEEPFQNPHDLKLFSHPLAVDESYPHDLSLEQLDSLPTLKALIYKPTLQGGLLNCLPLHEWTLKKGISLVLSASFESDLGLSHIAAMAQRLSLSEPIGTGTYHYACRDKSQHAYSL